METAFASVAYGHALYAPTPAGFFVLKWAWDPALLFFLFMAWLYVRGLKAFRGKTPVAPWQKALFFAGVAVLTIALLPPIDPLSDQLFFVHMIQHIMITSIGVPLMILGVPFYVSVRGISPALRRHVYFPLVRSRWLRAVLRGWRSPVAALVVYQCVYWFWHIPRFYNMALLNDAIHLVEHGTMAAAAIFMWRVVIDPHPLKSPLALPWRLLFLATVEASNIALSAYLTFTETVVYAYEGLPAPGWWAYDRVQDQRLGGLIMWVPGGFLTFITMTIVFFVWVRREEQKDPTLPGTKSKAVVYA
jgi:cytochrome c oxidase assembly factor CtaG